MRNSMYKINPLILNRWSPRSMTGEELSDDDMLSLFEAARWAPSSSNNQPWRFIYAKRNTEKWDRLFNLMFEGNKIWTKNAAVLVVVISRKNFEQNEKPSKTYQYEAGAAWENLALEAATRGLAAHGMAMIAIGKIGTKENLPQQLQEREHPNDRKPLAEIIMEGQFIK